MNLERRHWQSGDFDVGGNAASRVADGSSAFELGLNADMALQVTVLGQPTIGALSQAHGKSIFRSRRQ